MEIKDFMKYLNAICKNNKGKCNICMMGDYFKNPSIYCPLLDSTLTLLLEAAREDENDIFKKEETIRNLLSEVKQYSLTNPIHTRQEIFLEKYPKTMINRVDGCIDIKPCQIEGEEYIQKKEKCSLFECAECRRNYWSAEIEE